MHAQCAFQYDTSPSGRPAKCVGNCGTSVAPPHRVLSRFGRAGARCTPSSSAPLYYCFPCTAAFVQRHGALLEGHVGAEQAQANVAWRSAGPFAAASAFGSPPLPMDKGLREQYLGCFRFNSPHATQSEQQARVRHEALQRTIRQALEADRKVHRDSSSSVLMRQSPSRESASANASQMWSCPACTLDNPPSADVCEVCCQSGPSAPSADEPVAKRTSPLPSGPSAPSADEPVAKRPRGATEIAPTPWEDDASMQPPPAVASWGGQGEAQVADGNSDPQPLPGQTLTVHSKSGRRETRASTSAFAPFLPSLRQLPKAQRIDRFDVGGGRGHIYVLRNYDGKCGADFASALQATFGSSVLGGRGVQNQCSPALGNQCHLHGDTHTRLFPFGDGSACSAGQQEPGWAADVMRPFFRAVAHDVGVAASPTERGSVQLLRYRAPHSRWPTGGPEGASAKRAAAESARLHMHVDNDPRAGHVAILSLGHTCTAVVDHVARCTRCTRAADGAFVANPFATELRFGRSVATASSREAFGPPWFERECSTCQEITLDSGDCLVFDGHPTAGVAHGVLCVLPPSRAVNPFTKAVARALPEWAAECRVSVQYRQLVVDAPPHTTVAMAMAAASRES